MNVVECLFWHTRGVWLGSLATGSRARSPFRVSTTSGFFEQLMSSTLEGYLFGLDSASAIQLSADGSAAQRYATQISLLGSVINGTSHYGRSPWWTVRMNQFSLDTIYCARPVYAFHPWCGYITNPRFDERGLVDSFSFGGNALESLVIVPEVTERRLSKQITLVDHGLILVPADQRTVPHKGLAIFDINGVSIEEEELKLYTNDVGSLENPEAATYIIRKVHNTVRVVAEVNLQTIGNLWVCGNQLPTDATDTRCLQLDLPFTDAFREGSTTNVRWAPRD